MTKEKIKYFTFGALSFFGALFLTVYLFCPHCKDEQQLVIEKADEIADIVKERVFD